MIMIRRTKDGLHIPSGWTRKHLAEHMRPNGAATYSFLAFIDGALKPLKIKAQSIDQALTVVNRIPNLEGLADQVWEERRLSL